MKFRVIFNNTIDGEMETYTTDYDTVAEAIAHMERIYNEFNKYSMESDQVMSNILIIDGEKSTHISKSKVDNIYTDTRIVIMSDETITQETMKQTMKQKADSAAKLLRQRSRNTPKPKGDPTEMTASSILKLSDVEVFKYFGEEFKYDSSRATIIANFKTHEWKVISDSNNEDTIVDKYNETNPGENEIVIALFGRTYYWTKTVVSDVK